MPFFVRASNVTQGPPTSTFFQRGREFKLVFSSTRKLCGDLVRLEENWKHYLVFFESSGHLLKHHIDQFRSTLLLKIKDGCFWANTLIQHPYGSNTKTVNSQTETQPSVDISSPVQANHPAEPVVCANQQPQRHRCLPTHLIDYDYKNVGGRLI